MAEPRPPSIRPDERGWRPSRRLVLTLAAAGATALTGCSNTTTAPRVPAVERTHTARPGTLGDALYVAGFQTSRPRSFNPLGAHPSWPAGPGAMQVLYESLMRFNLLDGRLEPGLATTLEAPDAATIRVTLQKGVTFSDGKALTVEDVVNTFTLAKRHPGVPYADVWRYLTAVEADGDDAVVFELDSDKPNSRMVESLIAGTPVLPKHVWDAYERSGQLMKTANTEPVGTGPYLLDTFDENKIVLERNDSYWGKALRGSLPAPARIVHPIFPDAAAGTAALERGQVDVSAQSIPQIWKMWENGAPISTWKKKVPYHVPGSIPFLWLNVHRKGLDNVKVRRALAHCINYAQIAQTAMSNYSIPAHASAILPSGAEASYYDGNNVKRYGWTYDVGKAVSILEDDLGCEKGTDGIYRLPDGTRLGPWTAITPAGWSDWQAALQIVASSAKVVGIDVRATSPRVRTVAERMRTGTFSLAGWVAPGVSPASPWSRFHDLLESRGVPPIGAAARYNFGRFSHPDVPALLDAVGAAGADKAKLKELYGGLDAIYMRSVPAIGLAYRPLEFYEYNAATWTNFPNVSNAYAPPQFSGAGTDWLFEIKHV